MSGNGKRAARRFKELSKPLENGNPPPFAFIAINPGTGTFLRRLAHHKDRRAVHNQLVGLTTASDFHDDEFEVVKVDGNKRSSNYEDWMPLLAHRCGAVTVVAHHVFFHTRP